jgi:hypothetical protein
MLAREISSPSQSFLLCACGLGRIRLFRRFGEEVVGARRALSDLTFGEKATAVELTEGFDVKVLREILRLRKLDKEDREEHESLVDLYLRAMESASRPDARAHRARSPSGD